MNLVAGARNLFVRLRYPVSLPQDVGSALGVPVSNSVRFQSFLQFLTSGQCIPTKLVRFMEREKVERAFEKARRKESFHHHTLYSFYFNQGWLEFDVEFDKNAKLRRIYVHHKEIPYPQGYELALSE